MLISLKKNKERLKMAASKNPSERRKEIIQQAYLLFNEKGIGEIRDSIAAEMAVRCALTGHLVVSSIHSSNSLTTIQRMLDFGVSEFQLYDVLKGISNQRLLTDKNHNKHCIYEFMDQKEIEYYVRNKSHSENFKTIEDKLREYQKQNNNIS